MIFVIKKKKLFIIIITIILILLGVILFSYFPLVSTIFVNEELSLVVEESFAKRNKAILNQDNKSLSSLYNKRAKYGLWAYEHEIKKMKYLHMWSQKQGIKFIDIKSTPVIRWVKDRNKSFTINLIASTEYRYIYLDDPDKINLFRIGTYHSLDMEEINENWVITREWYTDPFADSLNLNNIKSESIKKYITNQEKRDFQTLSKRRKKALEYADKYVGAADNGENDYKYNKKYRDYNALGGDCANFASQILFEGGNFRKNGTWNYKKSGSRAWVNAQGFKSYMIYSGRASVIAYGDYEKVFKHSYKLLPGDFIAYEKKGKVKHISTVTGADSKGYALVNCHNTDRYRVPWDLGWSNKNIKFWLVRVHY
ncbi:MAG: amidase domain-containing protein [Firmicutes bacterium]|nr:amidase domain-containing protein [Bacillota bacterium]